MMERKIGEIFEYNGEWYQCVKSASCGECAFFNSICIDNPRLNCSADDRNDNCSVVFKKLEKIGNPFSCNYYGDARLVMMQEYQLFDSIVIYCNKTSQMYITDYKHKRIAIEIKVNKEDMGENDIKPYDRFFSEGTVSNTEHLATSNLKPFDLEKAKLGKPVCTRDGRKARIISCSLRNKNFPIAAIVEDEEENVYQFEANGVCDEHDENLDLMMLPEKKEGWANVYKDSVYDTKEEALAGKSECRTYIDTIKISWEE